MTMMRRRLWLALGAAWASPLWAQADGANKPRHRTIYMATLEPKGATSAAEEPFPATALPGDGGYLL